MDDLVEFNGWFLLANKSDWARWSEIESMDSVYPPDFYPVWAQTTLDDSQWRSPQYLSVNDVSRMKKLMTK